MNYLKVIGFGMLIWAVAFVVVSAFIGFGVDVDTDTVGVATVLAIFLITLLLAKNLGMSSKKRALVVGVIWVVTLIVLDAVITMRFTGSAIFTEWSVITGYVIVLVIPPLMIRRAK